MKIILFIAILLLSTVSLNVAQAQQTSVDDALLLDLYQNQRFAEATDYLKKSFPEPVTDLKVLSRLAYTSKMAGKLPEAESYYLRIYKQDSTGVPVLLNLAGIQIKRANDNKAIFYYEKAAKIDTANFTVAKQLGNLYAEKLDTTSALKYLQKANRLQPEEADVASDLSLLLVSMKKIKPAATVLDRALAADSTNLLLLRSLAKLHYTNDEFKDAVKVCEKLKLLGGGSGEVSNMLATSYYMIKIYDCAIDNFASLTSQTERTYYLTAMSYKALAQYKRAATYFDKTLGEAISPYTNIYYNEKGDASTKTGDFKIAAEAYEKEQFFKEKSIIYYTLAALYDKDLNDKKMALKFYKKYLQTKPSAKQQTYISFTQSRISELSK